MVRLLADTIVSFDKNCALGIAAKTEKKVYAENISLKGIRVALGFLTEEKIGEAFYPEAMI